MNGTTRRRVVITGMGSVNPLAHSMDATWPKLVAGESGTGKELVAKAIHHASPRSRNAFVKVNSGSLPPELLESSLFGHMKGAFTGAIATKRGLFEVADGGSIFLDEIGNINLDTQAKLLRVIQEKEFMRLGSVDVIKVDVRIIAASNADLSKLMAENRFDAPLLPYWSVLRREGQAVFKLFGFHLSTFHSKGIHVCIWRRSFKSFCCGS